MKKLFYLITILTFCFSFLGVANAEEPAADINEEGGITDTPDENNKIETINDDNDNLPEGDNEDEVDGTNEEKTSKNPNTGLNDYIVYIVPGLLIAGSFLIVRKNSYN